MNGRGWVKVGFIVTDIFCSIQEVMSFFFSYCFQAQTHLSSWDLQKQAVGPVWLAPIWNVTHSIWKYYLVSQPHFHGCGELVGVLLVTSDYAAISESHCEMAPGADSLPPYPELVVLTKYSRQQWECCGGY